MAPKLGPILIGRDKIQERVKELAKIIMEVYGEDLPILLPVLTGSFIFVADLVRLLPPSIQVSFIKAYSYGDKCVSSGKVVLTGLENLDITGKKVLIIEDIIDTGLTLNRLITELKRKEPKDVKVCVLLDKPSRRKTLIIPDLIGFEVPDVFVIGYGLDFAENYRGIPDIHEMSEE